MKRKNVVPHSFDMINGRGAANSAFAEYVGDYLSLFHDLSQGDTLNDEATRTMMSRALKSAGYRENYPVLSSKHFSVHVAAKMSRKESAKIGFRVLDANEYIATTDGAINERGFKHLIGHAESVVSADQHLLMTSHCAHGVNIYDLYEVRRSMYSELLDHLVKENRRQFSRNHGFDVGGKFFGYSSDGVVHVERAKLSKFDHLIRWQIG